MISYILPVSSTFGKILDESWSYPKAGPLHVACDCKWWHLQVFAWALGERFWCLTSSTLRKFEIFLLKTSLNLAKHKQNLHHGALTSPLPHQQQQKSTKQKQKTTTTRRFSSPQPPHRLHRQQQSRKPRQLCQQEGWSRRGTWDKKFEYYWKWFKW